MLELEYLKPEFIIAGKTGEFIIINMKSIPTFDKWRDGIIEDLLEEIPKIFKESRKGVFSKKVLKRTREMLPIPKEMLNTFSRKAIAWSNIEEVKKIYSIFIETESGKKAFEKWTGVSIIPYKRDMKIDMRNDPIRE